MLLPGECLHWLACTGQVVLHACPMRDIIRIGQIVIMRVPYAMCSTDIGQGVLCACRMRCMIKIACVLVCACPMRCAVLTGIGL